jgi:uncharacterized membrane protein
MKLFWVVWILIGILAVIAWCGAAWLVLHFAFKYW